MVAASTGPICIISYRLNLDIDPLPCVYFTSMCLQTIIQHVKKNIGFYSGLVAKCKPKTVPGVGICTFSIVSGGVRFSAHQHWSQTKERGFIQWHWLRCHLILIGGDRGQGLHALPLCGFAHDGRSKQKAMTHPL